MKKVYEKPVVVLVDKAVHRYSVAYGQLKKNKEPVKKPICG